VSPGHTRRHQGTQQGPLVAVELGGDELPELGQQALGGFGFGFGFGFHGVSRRRSGRFGYTL